MNVGDDGSFVPTRASLFPSQAQSLLVGGDRREKSPLARIVADRRYIDMKILSPAFREGQVEDKCCNKDGQSIHRVGVLSYLLPKSNRDQRLSGTPY